MKSPFPGMDPYLEASWSDVHAKLTVYLAEAIMPLLPPGLRLKTEVDVEIQSSGDDDGQLFEPDVVVLQANRDVVHANAPTLVAPEPVRVYLERSPRPSRRVVILDSHQGNRLVTAIEILSPSNKAAGKGNLAYRRKLEAYRNAEASIVEIDLLRHPTRARLEVGQDHLPPGRQAPYLISVCRAWEPEYWDIYPVGLRSRIPPFPIPLRQKDKQLMFDLQPLIDRTYAAADYGSEINYALPPEPPLSQDDAVWAASILQTRQSN